MFLAANAADCLFFIEAISVAAAARNRMRVCLYNRHKTTGKTT